MTGSDQALRRQAAWRIALSCGRELTPAVVGQVLTQPIDDLRTVVLEHQGCPLQ
jgi:hypothetical protein